MPDKFLCISKAKCMLNNKTIVETLSLDFIDTHISLWPKLNSTLRFEIKKFVCDHGLDDVNDTDSLCLSLADPEAKAVHSNDCSFSG
jgi:hypothetical protein